MGTKFLLSGGKCGNIDKHSSRVLQSSSEETIYISVKTIFQALSLCAAVPCIHVLHVTAEQKLNQADHEMTVSCHSLPQLFIMLHQLGTGLQSRLANVGTEFQATSASMIAGVEQNQDKDTATTMMFHALSHNIPAWNGMMVVTYMLQGTDHIKQAAFHIKRLM